MEQKRTRNLGQSPTWGCDVRLHQVVGHIKGELHSRLLLLCAPRHPRSLWMLRRCNCWNQYLVFLWRKARSRSSRITRVDVLLRKKIVTFCLAEVFALCDKDIFRSVHNVLQLLLTVPQTSVTVERLLLCETHKNKTKITDDNRETDLPLSNTVRERPCENYRSRAYAHTFQEL